MPSPTGQVSGAQEIDLAHNRPRTEKFLRGLMAIWTPGRTPGSFSMPA